MNGFVTRHAFFAVGTLYLCLAMPPARALLEATMTAHMLVQIPLLVVIGIVACLLLPMRWQDSLLDAAGGAVACVSLAVFASTWWMLPRALDAALENPLADAAKFLSLPALVGLPLALAWKRLSAIGRGFVWTNFVSMLAVLGWLYIAAPVRVCNNYLVDEQAAAGWLMVKLSVLLFAWWLGTLFVGGTAASAAVESVKPRSVRTRLA
jgi:hypothetical protein